MNGNHIKWLPQEGKCRKESESGILENSSNPSWRSLEKIKIVAGTTVSQPREKTKWFIVDISTNIIKGSQKRKWSRWPIGSSIRFRTKRAWVNSGACGNNVWPDLQIGTLRLKICETGTCHLCHLFELPGLRLRSERTGTLLGAQYFNIALLLFSRQSEEGEERIDI